MKTDSICYQLFETSTELVFLIEGQSSAAARALGARFQFEAVEFKETSHRVDGVLRPKELGLPLYFLEMQFYRLPNIFADILVKAYSYLKQHDPGQAFRAVVLFATRALAPKELAPYQPLLDCGMLKCFYLDELPEIQDGPLSLAILTLIGRDEASAPERARELVARTKSEIVDLALRSSLVQLIETIVFYKLPHLSREEIEAMLQVSDIRETRVYREAKEEGRILGVEQGIEKGIEKGIEAERQRIFHEKIQAISKLAGLNLPAEHIADILKLDTETIRKHLANGHS